MFIEYANWSVEFYLAVRILDKYFVSNIRQNIVFITGACLIREWNTSSIIQNCYSFVGCLTYSFSIWTLRQNIVPAQWSVSASPICPLSGGGSSPHFPNGGERSPRSPHGIGWSPHFSQAVGAHPLDSLAMGAHPLVSLAVGAHSTPIWWLVLTQFNPRGGGVPYPLYSIARQKELLRISADYSCPPTALVAANCTRGRQLHSCPPTALVAANCTRGRQLHSWPTTALLSDNCTRTEISLLIIHANSKARITSPRMIIT